VVLLQKNAVYLIFSNFNHPANFEKLF